MGAVLRDDQFNIKARRVADRVLVISKTRAVYMTFPLTIYSLLFFMSNTTKDLILRPRFENREIVTESCNIYI